jgi:hypothetical protein
MPNTPLLNIPQVSASQNNKEITINDSILALENATNANLSVSFAGGSTVTLTATQATRNFVYTATGASGASTLRFPNTIGATLFNRAVCVRNTSGAVLTVSFQTGTGASVEIPDGQARLILAVSGTDMIVVSAP